MGGMRLADRGKHADLRLWNAGPMPLLRMYGVMLACYLIVTSVSVKRYPAFSGLLWIEGGLVEFTTCVVYGVIVLSSLWAYIVRLRSPVLIATFVTAALCMASEMSLVFWIMHDSTPDVPIVGEGKVFLDAPHDLIKLATSTSL